MASLEVDQMSVESYAGEAWKSDPLVSVVIPTFNRAELTVRALQSVLSQTYQSLDVIVVDDASTDNTHDRIKALQKTDPRIVYLCHPTNRGAQAARNTGIHAAKGAYIAFLDSDDEWLPEKLQLQMALFSQAGPALGVVYCGIQEISADGKMLDRFAPRFRGSIHPQALSHWVAGTDTLVIRREFLEKIGGFDERVFSYQEWDLCIQLAKVCEFDFIPECLALYHQDALITISKDHLRNAKGYLKLVEKYRSEILNECGRRVLSDHYLTIGRLFYLSGQFDSAKNLFLESLRTNPLQIKALIHFGTSLLGPDIYQSLRSLNQKRIGRE